MTVVPFAQHTAASGTDTYTLPAVTNGLGTNELVHAISIRAAAGNTSYVSVVDTASGAVLADVEPPTASNPGGVFCIKCPEGMDGVDPTKFTIAYHSTGDKAYAYAVVE